MSPGKYHYWRGRREALQWSDSMRRDATRQALAGGAWAQGKWCKLRVGVVGLIRKTTLTGWYDRTKWGRISCNLHHHRWHAMDKRCSLNNNVELMV